MSHTLIKEQVDIYQLPEVCYETSENTQVTIGDLHGNAMKLLFMLVKQGIATNISAQNYKNLVDIYLRPVDELTVMDVIIFNWILDGIHFKKSRITLIGDELCDRGSNDIFTLNILRALRKQEVPVEILISNHSMDFLEACEKFDINNHFHAPRLKPNHAVSLENLNTLVNKGIVSAAEVLNLAKDAYKPDLKVISYSLNEDNSEITINSHAPVGLNTIKGLAAQFDVPYRDSTAVALARTIDRINRKFQKHVKQGTVHTLCPDDVMSQVYGMSADLTTAPFVFAMWNRRYDLIDRPASQHGYKLVYVHGHDDRDPEPGKMHIYNLDDDNNLGKSADLNTGNYVVLNGEYKPRELIENLDIGLMEKKIAKEVARLKESKSDAGNFLVQIGWLEPSDEKCRALEELDVILKNGVIAAHSEDEFNKKLGLWKRNNTACLTKQRNYCNKFFPADQQPASVAVIADIYAELGFAY